MRYGYTLRPGSYETVVVLALDAPVGLVTVAPVTVTLT
jgi:hypothetical protein